MSQEERRAHWAQVVGEHESSGLSARRFCADRGVSVAGFYQWRKRLALAAGESEAPGFVEVNVTGRDADAGVRLRVANGSVEIVLARHFDAGTLQKAVAALSGPAV